MAEIQKVTLGIYTCRTCGSVDACSEKDHAGDGEERTPFVAFANTPGNIEAIKEAVYNKLEAEPVQDMLTALLAVLGLTGGKGA